VHFCQRCAGNAFDFNVIQFPEEFDEPVCGKPAYFRSRIYIGEEFGEVDFWLCADCFDEYESRYGVGSWADEE
jgi:hypothetical protein